MLESDQFAVSHQNQNRKYSAISCLVSLLSVLFTQFALSRLPLLLPTSSILSLLPLAVLLLVIVVGLGRLCKRIAGVRASPLAYVFFSNVFIWGVYLLVVRQVISFWGDIVLNIEMILLIIGLYCIASVDPGFVTHHFRINNQFEQCPPGEVEARGEMLQGLEVYRRIRYCKHCQKLQDTAEFQTLKDEREATASQNLVTGTMLFCLIQVLWQVPFMTWHVYCVCVNIKTDEWINWKRYPEFQVKIPPHAEETWLF